MGGSGDDRGGLCTGGVVGGRGKVLLLASGVNLEPDLAAVLRARTHTGAARRAAARLGIGYPQPWV